MTEWPTQPHDGLGGPQHYPIIIPALVFRDCMEESCDHDGFECPTDEGIVCGQCTNAGFEVGDVAFSQAWPCEHAEVAS